MCAEALSPFTIVLTTYGTMVQEAPLKARQAAKPKKQQNSSRSGTPYPPDDAAAARAQAEIDLLRGTVGYKAEDLDWGLGAEQQQQQPAAGGGKARGGGKGGAGSNMPEAGGPLFQVGGNMGAACLLVWITDIGNWRLVGLLL